MQRLSQLLGVLLAALILSACGQSNAAQPTHGGAETDHHSAAGQASSAPFDARFIDGMIEHHRGAVTMAEQALQQSQRPEITQMARTIIDTQQQEITQMTNWRAQWYPDLAPTGGTDTAMGDMSVSDDGSTPYDQRFISAMIAHHNGAIEMARAAQTQAEHAELRQLAATIITAQQAEVVQLEQWRGQWFGN